MPEADANERTRDDAVVELVARCLQRGEDEGDAAVDEVCQEHPEHAPAVRERLAVLARLGLARPVRHGPLTFGRFVLLRELGRGGMGVVYLARDDQLGREVALKALGTRLMASERARARFEREIRAAAALKHPQLVPIYEVGEENGIPYFTMEYVEGRTLGGVIHSLRSFELPTTELNTTHLGLATLGDDSATEEWLDEDEAEAERTRGAGGGGAVAGAPAATPTAPAPQPAQLPELPAAWGKTYVEAVCRIVLDVADALQHAHDHGVVHRDVKPSNVLISRDGRAHLFDFGLARLESDISLTLTGDFAGTPYYVSPEQARGRKLDHRTDIYSLGVTLYELLTLRRPFEGKSPQQVFRQIMTREPPLVRKVNRLVPRDLETVCLTAIEKDPARRYQSAAELAADLRRFLAFRPVQARPVGLVTRAARFVRRNPAPATAGVLGVLLLVVPLCGLIWHDRLMAREVEQTRLAARTAGAVGGFLREILESADPDVHGREMSVRDVLDRAALELDGRFDDAPLVEASLRETIGNTYYALGHADEGVRHVERALELFEAERGSEDRHVALTRVHFARALLGASRWAEAEREARAGIATLERVIEGDHDSKAVAYSTLAAIIADHRGAYAEAERLFRAALDMRLRLFGEQSSVVADNLGHVGRLLYLQNDPRSAYALYERAHAIDVAVHGEDHPKLAHRMIAMSSLLHHVGRIDEAQELVERAIELRRASGGDDHHEVATAKSNLAHILRRRGELDDAERLGREALATMERLQPGDSSGKSVVLASLGDTLAQAGRLDEAEQLLSRSFEMRRRLRREQGNDPSGAGLSLARLYGQRGDVERAAQVLRSTLALREAALSPDHLDLATVHYMLGDLETTRGELEAAEPHLREAIRIQRLYHFDTAPALVLSMDALCDLLWRSGRYAEAEEYARTLSDVFCDMGGAHDSSAAKLVALARLLYQQGELEEAESVYREALAWQQRRAPNDHHTRAQILVGLALVFVGGGDDDAAEPLLFEAHALLDARYGPDGPATLSTQAEYARCLLRLGDVVSAEPLLWDCWARRVALEGVDGEEAGEIFDDLVRYYETAERPRDVEQLFEAANLLAES